MFPPPLWVWPCVQSTHASHPTHPAPWGRAGGTGSWAGRRSLAPDCLSWASREGWGCLVPTLGLLGSWGRGENLHGTCQWLLFPGLYPWPIKLSLLGCPGPWVHKLPGFCLVLSLWITVAQLKSRKCKKEREEKEVWKYSLLPCVTLERQIACLRRHLSFIQPGCSSGK